MDHDGDGHLDLVSGSYQPGSIYLFRGLGRGRFAGREEIRGRDGQPLNPGQAADAFPDTRNFRRKSATEPCFADWDQDGDLDLLIGSMEGEIVLVVNEGTRREPVYARPRLLEHAGRPIRVWGGEGAPEVADWDGDGLPDLLSGSGDGAVFFFRNVGKRGAPRLAEGQVLVPRGARVQVLEPGAAPVPGHTTRIHVADWNGDGKLDLLVGDMQRLFRLRPDLTGAEKKDLAALLARRRAASAEEGRLLAEREAEMYRLGHRPRGIFPRTNKKLGPIWERIAKIEKELERFTGRPTSHGFVWVFLAVEG